MDTLRVPIQIKRLSINVTVQDSTDRLTGRWRDELSQILVDPQGPVGEVPNAELKQCDFKKLRRTTRLYRIPLNGELPTKVLPKLLPRTRCFREMSRIEGFPGHNQSE